MLFMVILCVIIFALLVLVAAVIPKRTGTSGYELERRKAAGESQAAAILHREAALADILSLQRALTALLLVVFVTASVATFGWLLGIIVAAVVALEYGAVSRLPMARQYGQGLYEKYEARLLHLTERFAGVFRFLRSVTPELPQSPRLESREELEHLVAQSGTLLSTDEKKLFKNGLGFGTREVHEVMTPRSVIDSIAHKELLGPLVLDDLHKTGHSRFPVFDEDIDHIVGMLHVQDMLTLDVKRSITAEKAMEARVFYIREDQNLQHALAAFLRTHHHLFVVVNEFRETVGLLSLEDVIEAMLGRKIVDEFDAHDDLRVVAGRNPRGNNHPEKREDV